MTITVTNLLPGEPWSLGFLEGTWSLSGRAPADGQPMRRRITIPADLKRLGERRLSITTQRPAREALVNMTVLK